MRIRRGGVGGKAGEDERAGFGEREGDERGILGVRRLDEEVAEAAEEAEDRHGEAEGFLEWGESARRYRGGGGGVAAYVF